MTSKRNPKFADHYIPLAQAAERLGVVWHKLNSLLYTGRIHRIRISTPPGVSQVYCRELDVEAVRIAMRAYRATEALRKAEAAHRAEEQARAKRALDSRTATITKADQPEVALKKAEAVRRALDNQTAAIAKADQLELPFTEPEEATSLKVRGARVTVWCDEFRQVAGPGDRGHYRTVGSGFDETGDLLRAINVKLNKVVGPGTCKCWRVADGVMIERRK